MVPRLCSTSFGVEPSAGPEVEKYSTPLMLRWIARCTSDWTRSGIDAKSSVAAELMCVPHQPIGVHPKDGRCSNSDFLINSMPIFRKSRGNSIRPSNADHPNDTKWMRKPSVYERYGASKTTTSDIHSLCTLAV